MSTITTTRPDLIALARAAATSHALDGALVCAVCEQESSWNPWAIRFEPAFFARYVAPQLAGGKISVTEAQARAFSWGLMQVMGQVAREKCFVGASLAELCDPAAGLDIGCRVLGAKLAAAQGDVTRALLLWNGGSNPAYPAQVAARMAQYK